MTKHVLLVLVKNKSAPIQANKPQVLLSLSQHFLNLYTVVHDVVRWSWQDCLLVNLLLVSSCFTCDIAPSHGRPREKWTKLNLVGLIFLTFQKVLLSLFSRYGLILHSAQLKH